MVDSAHLRAVLSFNIVKEIGEERKTVEYDLFTYCVPYQRVGGKGKKGVR